MPQSIPCISDSSRQRFAKFSAPEAGTIARQIFNPGDIANAIAKTRGRGDFSCPSDPSLLLTELSSSARAHLSTYDRQFASLASSAGAAENLLAVRSKAALELAPFVIATQYLIHAVAGSWNNESRYALTTLRIHAIDVGSGQPGASRIDRYREVLRSYSVADVGADLRHTATDVRISEGAFNFASQLIIMGHFPESLIGEILGANLYLRQCGLLQPFRFIADSRHDDLLFLDLGVNPVDGTTDSREHSLNAVLEYLAVSDERELGAVVSGFHWARQQTETLIAALLGVLNRWLDPREAARHLVARRRREASVYHEKTKLGGEPMTALLARSDTSDFLERLASSPYVRQGDPGRSPLLNSLISPRAKMFRIFSRDDVSILHRWIAGLPYGCPVEQPAAYDLWKDSLEFGVASPSATAGRMDPPSGSRAAYPRLLHVEISPSDEAYARNYIDKWLMRSSRGIAAGTCPLPAQWTPGGLREWLHNQHESSNDSLVSQDQVLPSRDEVVADILSLAPLTMIDGAWLTGFAHPSMASSDSGYTLFETMFDELGNGIHELNHPVIYRDLLRAVHGELPPTADSRYANSACFNDRNFDLPVFWLAIGRYPQTYRPEIMGLNLAMELSGVGGGYRRTHQALVAYGFPSLFVDLHNSIDNIATGHSAWAAASVDAYISSLPSGEYDEAWARVRAGFVALNPPKEQKNLRKIIERVKSLL